MRPKKVAIIGAGPSGLVTAKTLLHNYPHGTFAPVVFDSRDEVGGLWPNHEQAAQTRTTAGRPGTLDPRMRTNLSRFTVAFSDLSWETVMGDADIPMFPQACQVGRYLAAYAERYIPKDVLRLGCRVIRTVRAAGSDCGVRWRVDWIQESAQRSNHETIPPKDKILSEDFDFLVVASGYFARPYIPTIPGLEKFTGQIVHSSAIQKGRDPLLNDGDGLTPGNVAVIGGSMSGVEAASAAALNQSSLTLDSVSKDRNKTRPTVHHVYSRPFWTLPTYVLHESSDETVSFLPLDLAMYDLDRRPPGPIEYALGPIPEEKAAKTTSYFRSLLGTEYEQFGYMQAPDAKDQAPSRPPWVAIGNEYAEYVRSGAIEATMGRAISAQPDPQTGLASINIKTSDDHSKTLDHISVIVMATGFTPFDSLSFLPADVLSALEYSSADPFLPLVLDQGGTLRSELPDIGFVGFYRGPYWGVMEMQARLLGKAWADKSNEPQTTENQRQSLRVLRHPNLELRRGQFPMGDYVGLMETFAKDLGISRIESTNGGSRSGPVIPSRYVYDEASTKSLGKGQTTTDPEAERTLDALRATYIHDHGTAQAAAALAIFRALHGTWKFKRWTPATGEEVISGTAVFHPRYPSDPAYDREYVYEEYPESSAEDKEPIVGGTAQSILHLSEGGTRKSNSRIEIWPLRPVQNVESALDGYALNMTPVYRKKRDGQYIPGEYVVSASSGLLIGTGELAGDVARGRYQYNFHFKGVSISSWERIDLGLDIAGGKSTSEDQAIVRYRSLYVR